MAKKKLFDKQAYIRQLVEQLANDGERIIKAAYNTRGFTNRTYNLHDSYASAVYVNGVLRHDSIRYIGPEKAELNTARELGDYAGDRTRPVHRATGGDKRYLKGDTVVAYGRDEAKRFLNDYKPTSSGIQLVVIAAMFYAGIVESKGYQVLSQSYTELLDLAKKYGKGATVKQLDVYRNQDAVGKGSFGFN